MLLSWTSFILDLINRKWTLTFSLTEMATSTFYTEQWNRHSHFSSCSLSLSLTLKISNGQMQYASTQTAKHLDLNYLEKWAARRGNKTKKTPRPNSHFKCDTDYDDDWQKHLFYNLTPFWNAHDDDNHRDMSPPLPNMSCTTLHFTLMMYMTLYFNEDNHCC